MQRQGWRFEWSENLRSVVMSISKKIIDAVWNIVSKRMMTLSVLHQKENIDITNISVESINFFNNYFVKFLILHLKHIRISILFSIIINVLNCYCVLIINEKWKTATEIRLFWFNLLLLRLDRLLKIKKNVFNHILLFFFSIIKSSFYHRHFGHSSIFIWTFIKLTFHKRYFLKTYTFKFCNFEHCAGRAYFYSSWLINHRVNYYQFYSDGQRSSKNYCH